MASYEFATIWSIEAPLEQVWEEVYHTERWPQWWKGVISVVELKEGDELGVGSIRRYTWKTKLPYRLIFDIETLKVEPMTYLEGKSSGELEGRGIWRLTQKNNHTIARYDWQVTTTKLWMNILAPIARPLFEWSHKVVMRWGAESLSNRLGARVDIEK